MWVSKGFQHRHVISELTDFTSSFQIWIPFISLFSLLHWLEPPVQYWIYMVKHTFLLCPLLLSERLDVGFSCIHCVWLMTWPSLLSFVEPSPWLEGWICQCFFLSAEMTICFLLLRLLVYLLTLVNFKMLNQVWVPGQNSRSLVSLNGPRMQALAFYLQELNSYLPKAPLTVSFPILTLSSWFSPSLLHGRRALDLLSQLLAQLTFRYLRSWLSTLEFGSEALT